MALPDYIGFAESFADFFAFVISEEVKAPTMFQDSASVISLVMKGGGITRTKHLCARMNVCKEAVEENRIRVIYDHTSKMLVDGLMKILEGNNNRLFCR